jgi:dTDP-glucose 4,6-dehydratase
MPKPTGRKRKLTAGTQRHRAAKQRVLNLPQRLSVSAVQPTSVVTGGAGFLGSHLVDLLLQRGHRVIAIDNLVTGSVENIDHLGGAVERSSFKFIKQDVTEYIFLHEPVDYVWHFASPASPIDYLELPIQTLKVG